MYFYRLENKIMCSIFNFDSLDKIDEIVAKQQLGILYVLNKLDPKTSRRSFLVTSPEVLFLKKEDLKLLRKSTLISKEIPNWIVSKISDKKVVSVNVNYESWVESLQKKSIERWKVNIVGMGDVGSTLLTGLRLLGGNNISKIGIYDHDKTKMARWEFEANQILSPNFSDKFPEVIELKEEDIFDCDMFVFCVSKGVPTLDSQIKDVRLAQFEGNSKIINQYARIARVNKFKGIFAVVSDPVDLLCKSALLASNKDDVGKIDFKGLIPEQIRGFGLGVMNARACYFAKKDPSLAHYLIDGRAFGPHGEGLIIADSIENYDELKSNQLTQKTQNANIELRDLGFKPYIAPALSSGSLSIISAIKNQWHYSSTFIGGTYMGARNRTINGEIELETLELSDNLFNKLQSTYKYLKEFFDE